jgi:hydrogenase small subunit
MPHVPQELATDREREHGMGASMNRRRFLRFSIGSLSVACLLPLHSCSQDSNEDDRSPLLWLETGVCTGCACSLLASFAPPSESLISELRLQFQETLMSGYGSRAVDELLMIASAQKGKYILVIDGAIPRGAASRMTMLGAGADGNELSAEALVAGLAAKAAQVIALGTCASFGGIPGSGAGTGIYVSVAEIIGIPPIRIPGCPPNPSWIASALTALLRGDAVDLDYLGRPTAFFGKTVHDLCPRLDYFKAADFARAPGDPIRCLFKVGCKGTMAMGDCPARLWQGRSYCIKANHPCIGCTTPGFLDPRPTVDGKDVGIEGRAATPFAKALEDLP